MKKHLLLSNLAIVLCIAVSFFGMMYRDTREYQALVETHAETLVRLAATDISRKIESTLSSAVTVSHTMANDVFLQDWIEGEATRGGDAAYLETLYHYLKIYQEAYQYDTSFFVSEATGHYYTQDGLRKQLSPKDAHDIWYYNFLALDQEYDLQVDRDENNGGAVTLFVNFRVLNPQRQVVGVIGMGLRMDRVAQIVENCEQTYDLTAYIISEGGAENSYSEEENRLFVRAEDVNRRLGIPEESALGSTAEDPSPQWFNRDGEQICLASSYQPTLRWNLVVVKNTDSVFRAFQQKLLSNFLFVILALLACLAVTVFVFFLHNRRVVDAENVDHLTGLPNRKLFQIQYKTLARRNRGKPLTLFLFDVDRFKEINDTRGHLHGNAVLQMVGEELSQLAQGRGAVCRWGGDEFLGVFSEPLPQVLQTLETLMAALSTREMGITISTGVTEITGNLSQAISQADQALYRAKANGRDHVTVFEKEVFLSPDEP